MSGAASHVAQSTTILGSVHGIWDACWKLPTYCGLFSDALLTGLLLHRSNIGIFKLFKSRYHFIFTSALSKITICRQFTCIYQSALLVSGEKVIIHGLASFKLNHDSIQSV